MPRSPRLSHDWALHVNYEHGPREAYALDVRPEADYARVLETLKDLVDGGVLDEFEIGAE